MLLTQTINKAEVKGPVICSQCSQMISPYYLSPVKLEDGRTLLVNRCLSCGFFGEEND